MKLALPDARSLRVLHAPIVALYQPWLYAEGLRAAGCQADYMCFDVLEQDKWLMHGCDVELRLGGKSNLASGGTRELDFFLHAIEYYDVFHLHSGYGLLKENWSLFRRCAGLRLLKKMGKKIVMHWWGCDRRTEETDAHYPYSACQECSESNRRSCRAPEKSAFYCQVNEYADAQLSNGDLCASLPHLRWFHNAIDTDLWRPMTREEIPEKHRLPPTDQLRIYHSFGHSESRGDVKGSACIREAVARLASEGHPVEFMFFDRVPNLELRYYQAQADIVVDQLRCGWHGSTAVECMACGKPVICYVRPEVARIAPPDHPLIHATMETICDILKQLLKNPDLRADTGQRSREYAMAEHSHIVLGRRLLDLYANLGKITSDA